MRSRITHFSDLRYADMRQCDGKVYKRPGCLKLSLDDVSCIKCLELELTHGDLKHYVMERLEDHIRKLTYRQEFDKLTK